LDCDEGVSSIDVLNGFGISGQYEHMRQLASESYDRTLIHLTACRDQREDISIGLRSEIIWKIQVFPAPFSVRVLDHPTCTLEVAPFPPRVNNLETFLAVNVPVD